MEEERRSGLTIKDLLIRLILIVIFVFLLIWLFPMPDLKPLNNQIFADNIDRMKDVAKSYYTTERLPKNINDFEKMTLREMIDNKLILPLTDSNGKTCSKDDSYIKITKLENEYVIKVYLSCSDKKDYIITHFGCYDICSDTCKQLETTTPVKRLDDTTRPRGTKSTTLKKTTSEKITTSSGSKLYEYEFTKRVCNEEFEGYTCKQKDYNLVGNVCIKNGSETVTKDANSKIVKITNTDTKPAKAEINKETKYVNAECKTVNKTSTINATPENVPVKIETKTSVQIVTAPKAKVTDVKGAVITTKTTNSDYTQNYDIITADEYVTEYKWTYVSTIKSEKSGLGHINDDEKVILVDMQVVPTCKTCTTMVKVYTYYKYQKKATKYEYSCDRFSGYQKYGTNKCRKATGTTKKCPDGFNPNGKVCTKTEETMSCKKYGSDYVLDKSKKTCTKTTIKYKDCPKGTEKTNDPKYCKKKVTVYECPKGSTALGNNKCSKVEYKCPKNTSDKTYKLTGTKCVVTSKVEECSCPKGSDETSNKKKCAVESSKTSYTCKDYPGYDLNGKKCTKTTVTEKTVYECLDKSYTLNGTKCVKTVNTSDTKAADKKYKTVCNNEYIWSSRTSISGWTYTGNKREIN